MRIDSAATLILLLAGLGATPAVVQDDAGLTSRNSRPSVTTIFVAEPAGSVDVEIMFTKLVRAEVNTLEHPDRLVFDFPGCELAHPGQRLVVNRGSVIAVRAAMFSVYSTNRKNSHRSQVRSESRGDLCRKQAGHQAQLNRWRPASCSD
jgi:hypothetical protein